MARLIHRISTFLFLGFILGILGLALFYWERPAPLSVYYAWVIGGTWVFAGLVWLDIFWVLGRTKGLVFLGLAAGIGFLAEFWGVNLGGVFGSAYRYSDLMGPMLSGVPVTVILMWTAIVYICYRLALTIAGKKIVFRTRLERWIEYATVAAVAALAAVAWDLSVDPLAVAFRSWNWDSSGPYFGIPTLNFMGWILVVFSACFIFEVLCRLERTETKDIAIPFMGYLSILISTILLAASANMPFFALLASMVMAPYLLIVILTRFKEEKPRP